MTEKFYITTPIYYPSNQLHLGNAYTTIVSDTIARYNKLLGKDVYFLTGTDEHGQKISTVAKNAGKTEKEYIDEIVADTKKLWKTFNIDYDRFIRTTDEDHVKVASHVFTELYNKGYIYKGSYTGKYCEPCESFWTNSQLVDGKCPDCGRDVIDQSEEAYFFKLSQFGDKLLNLYKEHSDFLIPHSRVNEMVNNFIKPGLSDLCVSRTSVKWGIPVPFEPNHTIYVWIDALTNYLTGIGYLSDDQSFKKWWPADVHIIGKDIVRFHAIIWPAILMALDLPLPKQILGHGWIMLGDDKLSKSKTNSSGCCMDPRVLAERYSSDAVRYVVLREMPIGSDLNYSTEGFLTRINSDLANNYGNLVSRSLSMLKKYNASVVPACSYQDAESTDLQNIVKLEASNAKAYMKNLDCSKALASIFNIFDKANKYIEVTEPYRLAKDPLQKDKLNTVLRNLLEAIRIGTLHLSAFMPDVCDRVLKVLNVEKVINDNFYSMQEGAVMQDCPILFPRLDIAKEVEALTVINK